MSDQPNDDEEYKRIFGLMRKDDQVAFRVFIISTNTEAYNDETKTASEWFLSWDVLEDAMPFLTEPAIEVDIQWTKSDLEQKVKEMGLEKGQTVILINPSKLKVGDPQRLCRASIRSKTVCDLLASGSHACGHGRYHVECTGGGG